jgi:hypothetical protein
MYHIIKHALYHRSLRIKYIASVNNKFWIRSRVVYISPCLCCMCYSLSICLSVRPSVRTSIHPSIQASIHASIHPSIHLLRHSEHYVSVATVISIFFAVRPHVYFTAISPLQEKLCSHESFSRTYHEGQRNK